MKILNIIIGFLFYVLGITSCMVMFSVDRGLVSILAIIGMSIQYAVIIKEQMGW